MAQYALFAWLDVDSRTAPAVNHTALIRERKKYAAQKVTQK